MLSPTLGSQEGDLDEEKVVDADLVLQLPQRLDERHAAQGEGHAGSGDNRCVAVQDQGSGQDQENSRGSED